MEQKLYTEEQVRTMLDLSKLNVYGTKIYSKDELIEQQKPIELPSDEEIEKSSPIVNINAHDYYFGHKDGFIEGAKWMKEQILKNK
jgi:hypothetical protein